MPLRLLITRPEPAATRMAKDLRGMFPGAEVVVSPLMRIACGGTLPALAAHEVLIFTSRHGIEGFCRLSPRRDLPACTVGCATAAEAQRRGFDVRVVAGDAEALLGRIATKGVAGPFLHARGAHVAADLAGALRRAGHAAREAVVYDQQALPLTDAARAMLDGDAPVILPLMSPRSATLFFEAAGTPRAPLLVAAISRNVAARIPEDVARRVAVAASPDIRALHNVLRDLAKDSKRVESHKGAQ
ncbi:uroporphyrinogen-III synthase [Roseovarius ramblicola]|uniref:Uroporphyrinogen-III synthase n=1 Tax=Roseovarius ramblicola TaxID=2022336 RepID=A0ABV5HXV5_9RHOB